MLSVTRLEVVLDWIVSLRETLEVVPKTVAFVTVLFEEEMTGEGEKVDLREELEAEVPVVTITK